MSKRSVHITPYSSALGAVVSGVDLAQPVSDTDFDKIRQAFLNFGVIFFRDQHLSHEQHIRFGKHFGSLHVHPLKQGNHPDHPELLRIHADETSRRVAGESETPSSRITSAVVRSGAIGDAHIRGELGDVLLGTLAGRGSDDEITLFKSLGLAVEDVAAAHHVYLKAQERSVGVPVEVGGLRDES